jgi:hypothetical protein
MSRCSARRPTTSICITSAGSRWYQSHFPPDEAAGRFRVIGEVTPDYLTSEEAPGRIHRLLPECRLIAIPRNPVEQAWSDYRH